MSGIMLGTVLTPGCKYRIRWQTSLQRHPREAVMTFLCMEGDTYTFSARPKAGTQTLDHHFVRNVTSVEQVSATVESYPVKVVREGT